MTPIPLATLFASRWASGAFADSRNRTVEPSRGADSYVFDGQTGYLYHDLASANRLSRVAGTAKWHTNANEPCAFDYNDAPADTGESEGNPGSDHGFLFKRVDRVCLVATPRRRAPDPGCCASRDLRR